MTPGLPCARHDRFTSWRGARRTSAIPSGGLRRSIELFRAFRVEQTDPDHFYRVQAADSIAQLRRYTPVAGRTVLDVGGGAGYFTEAFVSAGARCALVEPEAHPAGPDHDESDPAAPGGGVSANGGGQETLHGAPDADAARREMHRQAVRAGRLAPHRTIAGDGNVLPFADGAFDVAFSSNVLEHVPIPPGSSTRWCG